MAPNMIPATSSWNGGSMYLLNTGILP